MTNLTKQVVIQHTGQTLSLRSRAIFFALAGILGVIALITFRHVQNASGGAVWAIYALGGLSAALAMAGTMVFRLWLSSRVLG